MRGTAGGVRDGYAAQEMTIFGYTNEDLKT
jgi:hypothetical protein